MSAKKVVRWLICVGLGRAGRDRRSHNCGRVPCLRHLKAPDRYCSYVRYRLPGKVMSLCSELLVGVDDPNGLLWQGNSTCKFATLSVPCAAGTQISMKHANKIT